MHTIGELQFAFSYDPLTGELTRRVAKRSDHFGSRVTKNNRVKFEGVHYTLTHLIWAVYYGHWPKEMIDHRDGDYTNTKLNNLREASALQNTHNRVGIGQYPKGVVLKKDTTRKKPWSARIRIDGRKIAIGSYATMEEAAEAYRKVVEKIQGEFAFHKS